MKKWLIDITGPKIMNRQNKLAIRRKRFVLLALLPVILALALILLSLQKLTETSRQAQNNGFEMEPSIDATSSSSLTLPRQQHITPSQTSTRQPALLHNVANIDYEGFTSYGTYNPAALNNANIGAVDINMNWAQIEPQQGIFNFAPADQEAAAWASKGKSFNLIVRYINEGSQSTDCSTAQLLPAWEISRIPHFCDADKGTLIPDYFDQSFKQDLKSYVNAIADHFARSPAQNSLLYVRIGVGEGGEGFPYMSSGDYAVDRQQLISYGYSPSVWAAWQEEMMTYYQAAFSYATVIYPLNGLDTDPSVGKPVQVEVAVWAASRGMGLGQQGLEPGSDTFILQTLRVQYPKMYIQYQTISAISGGAPEVQADIQAADKNGAYFIEWYAQDAINPAYQAIFAQWQQMVDSHYGS
jgi:hypothetical protein